MCIHNYVIILFCVYFNSCVLTRVPKFMHRVHSYKNVLCTLGVSSVFVRQPNVYTCSAFQAKKSVCKVTRFHYKLMRLYSHIF